MNTDAIVNTANEYPIVGPGCDRAVYEAAGFEELLSYRKANIGSVKEGEVFLTPGFHLSARYIIHAVSPRFKDGSQGEEELLRSCYRKSLALAAEKGFRSIAFPLISTGSFGYPKEEGMRIAVDEIHAFLLKSTMLVYLVVFGETAVRMGKNIFPDLESYIDQNYVEQIKKEEYEDYRNTNSAFWQRRRAAWTNERLNESKDAAPSEGKASPKMSGGIRPASPSVGEVPRKSKKSGFLRSVFERDKGSKPETGPEPSCQEKAHPSEPAASSESFYEEELSLWEASEQMDSSAQMEDSFSEPLDAMDSFAQTGPDLSEPQPSMDSYAAEDAAFEEMERRLSERMAHMADTFPQYLLYLIHDKGMENTEVYKRAIVDKKVFSKIKNNPDYHPQKLTALCLCIGAKLNLDESRDLLARAGYALSPCDKTDIIFSYFIENKIYDMIELDIQLEEHGLPCIIT